jgi:Raf kinase inhibitor-like YbhB/YbcL family protein
VQTSARLARSFSFPGFPWANLLRVALALACPMMQAGCGASAPPGEGTPALVLKSASFENGGAIPKAFSCDGADSSPALSWSAPPPETQSFALTVVDIDGPVGPFVHWVLYDVPSQTRALPEGLSKRENLLDGSRQGMTDFGKIGYGGPCPSGKSAHRYVFSLYAVDSRLTLPPGAKRKQLEKALRGHVLARGALTGKYRR